MPQQCQLLRRYHPTTPPSCSRQVLTQFAPLHPLLEHMHQVVSLAHSTMGHNLPVLPCEPMVGSKCSKGRCCAECDYVAFGSIRVLASKGICRGMDGCCGLAGCTFARQLHYCQPMQAHLL